MSPRDQILELKRRVGQSIIGQEKVIERLLIGLLANGNILMEGLPGLAKTRAIKTLSKNLESKFSRIQFTPDLLPSDVTGSEVYFTEGGKGQFQFQEGPLFGNLVLADEINRAPAKVQAALLEAMEERQVTVAGKTHKLPDLFMVLATQNPIEQEGTYPLPEAQRDRFLLHVMVRYPSDDDERKVMQLVRGEEQTAPASDKGQVTSDKNPTASQSSPTPQSAVRSPAPQNRDEWRASSADASRAASTPQRDNADVLPQSVVFEARSEVHNVKVSDAVEKYIVALVAATRRPKDFSAELAKWIHLGGSPRATLALDKAARALAWLDGRDHVEPDDVKAVAPDCLRHRLQLSYEASADGKTTDDVIAALLKQVAIG
jgi:MoxR-like ATPase